MSLRRQRVLNRNSRGCCQRVSCYLSWHGFCSYRPKSRLIYCTPVFEATILVNHLKWLLGSKKTSNSSLQQPDELFSSYRKCGLDSRHDRLGNNKMSQHLGGVDFKWHDCHRGFKWSSGLSILMLCAEHTAPHKYSVMWPTRGFSQYRDFQKIWGLLRADCNLFFANPLRDSERQK